MSDVTHYNHTTALLGEARLTLRRLITEVRNLGATPQSLHSDWAQDCARAWDAWQKFKKERYDSPVLHDDVWGREVLTQPAAIHLVTRWARNHDAVSFFDAGDVQSHGLQVVEDDRPGQTFTETGASYMGFACSAILATGIASKPFFGVAVTGDGSFTMNPQILIDGIQHKSHGVIVLLDNRRMSAISGLQRAQYGVDFATNDEVEVDYQAWAASVSGVQALHGGYSLAELEDALEKAHQYDGLSLVHLPVYFGDDALGGLGSFGRWNVGNAVEDVEARRHEMEI